jgi:hypothetical protein
MILPDERPEHTGLLLLFRIDKPEQAEAMHAFRAAFGAATDIEAITEDLFALHITPGVCACGGESGAA